MISKKMAAALNEQIGHELFSSNLYLAMASWAETANLPGFGKWLRTQAEEERSHGLKFYDYVLDQGEKAVIPALDKPEDKFENILDVFRKVLEHEKKITALVHKLQALAVKENDWATQVELAWFIKEQVEEEKNASLLVAHLEMIGDKSAAILNLDHQAGKRGK
jgi:ferritin